ncbi:YraN family protein [Xylanibacter muris]|uniref:UPF0102 protein HPS56_05865 n=1 Tax=Xylanibacter muris TaxID=2736290 RepID=A0ABX2APC7_9BACT|nr:YraN family protein [Xylanibacter muris]NPD91882.1 YraN family protein [Xylanibacter muris]
MAEHNILGHWGEDKAADYLEANGYGIVRRNWTSGHRDIDIIAHKNGTLVFIEVKTRRNNLFTEPQDAVNHRKIRSITLAANAFINSQDIDPRTQIRFDIITITGTPETGFAINHIEDAFIPLPY